MDHNDKICYFNGNYIPLKDAVINIQTHALQYGTACFGGMRGYWNAEKENIYIFRLNDHYQRLCDSAKTLQMKFNFTQVEFSDIIKNVISKSMWKQNVYLRPFIYKSDLELSPRLHNVNDSFALYSLPLNDYIDTKKGLKTCVSSWVRLSDNQIPTRSKANGGYVNSALAKSEALENGFDEAIFLDARGNLSEATAANIFIIKNGALHTPDIASSILEGITRKTIIELAKESGIEIKERRISRSELYTADEIFICGSGVQISWIKSVDNRIIGNGQIGNITRHLQDLFFEIVKGNRKEYEAWLTPVY